MTCSLCGMPAGVFARAQIGHGGLSGATQTQGAPVTMMAPTNRMLGKVRLSSLL